MAFCAFLRHIGAPTDRYLRRQGLPVLCEDPDVFVPLPRAWSFFEAAARNEDPALGWLVGAYVGDHGLNHSLLRELETAPTLLQAMRRLVQMASAEASHIQLGIKERPDDVLLYTHYSLRWEFPGYLTSQAYQLGVLIGLIRHFLGRRWVPDEIGTQCSCLPDKADETLPGSRILTEQPFGYIAVPRDCLHRPACRIGPKGGEANAPVLSRDFDFLDTLRALLEAYVREGYPSARFAAVLVNTSERTLSRRLSAIGLTYGDLVDQVRFNLAKKLLQQPEVQVGEVARSVGFEDQSHFTRMFRRVGGLSPSGYRKAICIEAERGTTNHSSV